MQNQTSVQAHLLSFIHRHCDIGKDVEVSTDLIATATIDSLLVADLTVEIESTFGVTLSVRDISPENFRTVGRLSELVAKKLAIKRGAA